MEQKTWALWDHLNKEQPQVLLGQMIFFFK